MIIENNPNGSTDISTLAKDTTLTNGTQKSQLVDLDGHVANVQNLQTDFAGNEYALVTQSIIHGKTTGGGGGYRDVKVTPSGALSVESSIVDSVLPTGASTSALQNTANNSLSSIDNKLTSPLLMRLKDSAMDGAGRVRVSQINSFGDYKVLNSFFETKNLEQVGTATFTVNANNVNMSVTSGQYGIIQTKQYHPYINGKSQIVQLTTFNFGSASNVEKSFGYYSSAATGTYSTGLDGFRIHKDTSNIYSIQFWRNGTQLTANSLLRANWIDKLDGTGASGANINFDNFNVFTFDFLYLGGTTLRCFINYNGEMILFAVFYYASTDNQPFMISPNKPLRWEIRSTTGTGQLNFVCGAVGSEGQTNGLGLNTTIKGATVGLSPLVSATKYMICSVRKSATYRDIYAIVESFEGIISTNDFVEWEIILNPTIAGVVTWSAVTGTPLEQATGIITNTVTGGFSLANTYSSLNMNNARQIENILARLNLTINNTMDIISLCATPSLGSGNVKVTGSMQVRWIY